MVLKRFLIIYFFKAGRYILIDLLNIFINLKRSSRYREIIAL